jgi:hypothetical protein
MKSRKRERELFLVRPIELSRESARNLFGTKEKKASDRNFPPQSAVRLL